jgi:hypothetical protein
MTIFMNRITILGIIIIAIGSALTYWIPILGIIVIAIGTAFTLYGPSMDSKKDKKELSEKLEEFSEKLIELKTDGGDTSTAVEEVNNEFNDWAKNFVESKGLMKIEMEKSEIEVKEKEEVLSKEWRKFYLVFFDNLNNLIEAYNSLPKTGHKVKIIRKEALPGNIFSNAANSFYWVIEFKENVFWYLHLRIERPRTENVIPNIVLSLLDNYSEKRVFVIVPSLTIYTSLEYHSISIYKEKWFSELKLERSYDLQDYEKHLKVIVQTIFEQQLLRLN